MSTYLERQVRLGEIVYQLSWNDISLEENRKLIKELYRLLDEAQHDTEAVRGRTS